MVKNKKYIKLLLKITILIFGLIFLGIIKTYAVDSTEQTGKIYMSRVVEDGVYIISSYQDSNFVLDIKDASLEDGAGLQLWRKNNNKNQKFYIEYVGNGYYKINNVQSAKVLDVPDASKEVGTKIQQYGSNDTSAQRWKIRKNIDGTYNFISENSGLALDIEYGTIQEGTSIQQFTYTNSYAQRFRLEKTEFVEEGITEIRKADNKNLSIDISNGSAEDGTEAQLFGNNGSLAQKFEIQKVGENEIRIRTGASGGWLKEESKNNGAKVIQSGNSSTEASDSDTWKVEWNNGIVLVNKESNLCMTIENNSNEEGAKIIVAPKDGTSAQSFILIKKDLLKDGVYEIQSALGKFVDLDNSGADWGTNIHTWDRTNQNGQKFRLVKKENGYVIYTMHNLAFDVQDGSLEDGANIRQWEDNNSDCQRWIPEIRDGGYIAFKNLNSGKYMDIENESSETGANILQNAKSDSKSQSWKLLETQYIEEVEEDITATAWGDDYRTDKDYLQSVLDRANRIGSDTDWFVAVDIRRFRITLLCKVDNKWQIDGCFNATMGYLGNNGMSHTGLADSLGDPELNYEVTHKRADTGEGNYWFVCYIDDWQGDYDNGQGFHDGYEVAGQSYESSGCPRLTYDHAKYLYDNVPIGSKVHIWHEW